MIARLRQKIHRLRKIISRTRWVVRLLNLPICENSQPGPGLILIQVDGLSYNQFHKALKTKRLPFLRKQIQQGNYTVKPFYSGMPSTTPAVQGELFYGVKTCVPAFEFISRENNQHHISFYPQTANFLAQRLEKQGYPLLAGGSAYSTIFTGGAEEARYCSQTMGLKSIARTVNPFKFMLILILHIGKLFRILAVSLIEFFLAIMDFFRGIVRGKKFFKELVFIPSRIIVCVLLRELVRFRIKMDVNRGVPIVCANLLAYDEQSHRRGPDSRFAHWSLKGIDDTIKDICRAASRSDCREYQTIVYSDHGQEAVTDYASLYGINVKDAIHQAFYSRENNSGNTYSGNSDKELANLHKRARSFLLNRRALNNQQTDPSLSSHQSLKITTMGPLGHIYLPAPFTRDLIYDFAVTLIQEIHIPLVLFQDNNIIKAINQHGTFDLESQPEKILGRDHPFLWQVSEDLARVCRHSDAGDMVISGWDPAKPPLSFNVQSGAHGGPGKEETRAVILLPDGLGSEKPYLRGLDLRHLVMKSLGIPHTND
ncbi:MAG: alkaline phosphatase family protein [Desulfonatronovibrio sp.]